MNRRTLAPCLALLVALSFLLLLGRQPGSRAIVELEALLQDDVYRVDAGKNIIRCKMAIASVDDAIEKLNYDLFYIKNMSFFMDLMIVLRTIKIVLFRKGSR